MTTPNGDLYRSAALRWQVSDAGHDPETPSGARLVEWASKQDNLPSVADLVAKATEWNLKPEPSRHDPATVEQAIAEARADGDYNTASILQRRVEKVRDGSAAPQPTDVEVAEIRAAREAAEAARDELRNAETEEERMAATKRVSAAWSRASALQSAAERRMRGVGTGGPPEPHPVQPTAGLSVEEQTLLEDTETPIVELIGKAREQGFAFAASRLQQRLERQPQR